MWRGHRTRPRCSPPSLTTDGLLGTTCASVCTRKHEGWSRLFSRSASPHYPPLTRSRTSGCSVQVFDLEVNKHEPICIQKVYFSYITPLDLFISGTNNCARQRPFWALCCACAVAGGEAIQAHKDSFQLCTAHSHHR